MALIDIATLKRGDMVLIYSPARSDGSGLGQWSSGLHVVLEVGTGGVSVMPAATLNPAQNFAARAADIVAVFSPDALNSPALPAGKEINLKAAVTRAPELTPSARTWDMEPVLISVAEPGRVAVNLARFPRLDPPGPESWVYPVSIASPPGHDAPYNNRGTAEEGKTASYGWISVPTWIASRVLSNTTGAYIIPPPGMPASRPLLREVFEDESSSAEERRRKIKRDNLAALPLEAVSLADRRAARAEDAHRNELGQLDPDCGRSRIVTTLAHEK